MSARIIAFPRSNRRRHSQDVIDAALRVRSIAIETFERNDAWHRIEGFEKAIKTLPGGRENLHCYTAVFGSDSYELAVRGPSAGTGDLIERTIAVQPANSTVLRNYGE
ncbi:MAG: hypothetical protein IPK66_17515 [Rhodospirillales bacterium]|nr:hypothetical protein [Rhodospirillales bacterium]